MRVKIGSTLSENLEVTGGAVQGSILGVMDHNATLEDVDDDINIVSEKYVDDLTIFEGIPSSRPMYTNGDNRQLYHATKCQESLEIIEESCEMRGLKINDKKTQLIAVSANKKTAVWLKTKDGTVIESASTMKLLGFMFE